MKQHLRSFRNTFIFTAVGLVGGFAVGYLYTHTLTGAFESLFLTAVLAVLEISLSFDNAVVNASVLRQMSPKWQHRFLTWGMVIAVFGIRIVFPLAVVSFAGGVSPWEALQMAMFRPREYAQVMISAHVPLAGFGGGFLLMVAFNFFFNRNKETHWFPTLEHLLARLGKMEAISFGLALLFFYVLSARLHNTAEQLTFLSAAILGLLTYLIVDGISAFLELPEGQRQSLEKASVALFLYLEILDASFSFDGVIGAFAITSNLFIIAIGLSIGALFVRQMTIMLVEHKTLDQFVYLEHGAFYAIGALALMMVLDVFTPVPEAATGLIGAVIIGLAIYSSIRQRRRG